VGGADPVKWSGRRQAPVASVPGVVVRLMHSRAREASWAAYCMHHAVRPDGRGGIFDLELRRGGSPDAEPDDSTVCVLFTLRRQ
jgi:hypothetical protein